MTPRTKLPWVLVAGAAIAAAGCAGDEAAGQGRTAAGSSASGVTATSGGTLGRAVVESFPAQTRAFMEQGLRQFSRGDPGWEETRAQWLAMGPREASFLVSTMWAALLTFQKAGQPQSVERARFELARIGPPAVPLLAEFLAGGTAYTLTDPQTGERRDVPIDDFARREASEILGLVGEPAVGAVRDALEKAPSKAGRVHSLKTLGYIGERGGAAASEPLVRFARDPDDVLRVEAVHALRHFRDASTRDALISALGDGEELVRKNAAESLVVRREAGAAGYLRGVAQKARGEGRLAEAAEMERMAARLDSAGR